MSTGRDARCDLTPTDQHCGAELWDSWWSLLCEGGIGAEMENFTLFLLWCAFIAHTSLCQEVHRNFEEHSQLTQDSDVRGRRDVIEEEKYYNIHADNKNTVQPTPWMPHSLDDPTTKVSITNDDVQEVLPLYQTTERVTDRPTGRGARASNENWIKLPFPGRDDTQDDILSPPQPSGELINSRMPRVNFVTQNKGLEASESRNDKESIQRPTRNDEIRTEFVRPGEDRAKLYKPVYPRQAIYYPEESRRYIDDRYYPADDYRREAFYDPYARPRPALYPPVYPGVPGIPGPRVDRYDEVYDNVVPRKPKRIIYYAHLPEVVRTPPSVDLRYRYTVDPYRRPYEDDVYARNGRYDYRFRNPRPYPPNPYPYAPLLRKEERNYRDLAGAGTAVKDKKVEEKVTPTPILPKKADETYKNNANNRNANRNLINSHQYHDGSSYNDQLTHKAYPEIIRPDDGYLRYDEPMFQGTVEDPYQRKY